MKVSVSVVVKPEKAGGPVADAGSGTEPEKVKVTTSVDVTKGGPTFVSTAVVV